jgi:hypothetical protein
MEGFTKLEEVALRNACPSNRQSPKLVDFTGYWHLETAN